MSSGALECPQSRLGCSASPFFLPGRGLCSQLVLGDIGQFSGAGLRPVPFADFEILLPSRSYL